MTKPRSFYLVISVILNRNFIFFLTQEDGKPMQPIKQGRKTTTEYMQFLQDRKILLQTRKELLEQRYRLLTQHTVLLQQLEENSRLLQTINWQISQTLN